MKPSTPAFGNVTLRQIRAFISVASCGSFTEAAGEIGLTQSAVSVLVAELERGLDIKLFDRTTRSVRLTDAGQEFFIAARNISADLQTAISGARELAGKKRGLVSIAATPLISSLLLPPIIRTFKERYPDVGITVRDIPVHMVQRVVAEAEADLGIATTPLPTLPLSCSMLMMDEVVLVCPADSDLVQREAITWRDLAKFPFIAVARESGTREIVDTVLEREGVSLTPSFEVSSIWALLGMVSAGLGVALTSSNARWLTPLYPVAIRRLEGDPIMRPIFLLRHQSRSLSPAAVAFHAVIREYVGVHPKM